MDCLDFLAKEIHSVIMATTDDNGLPITCAVDIMDCDERGIYFLTAKGKGFYKRLKRNGYVALTGMKGDDTLSCKAISVRGKVKEIGADPLKRLLDKNPYMHEIYPSEESRKALAVFLIYDGSGEWFDLSQKPIERFSFSIGGEKPKMHGYIITDSCENCRKCAAVCPQICIDFSGVHAVIKQKNCLHCGNCFNVCPKKAVLKEE